MNFTIPDVPVSLNRLERMHWAVRRRYNMDWYWKVKVYAQSWNNNEKRKATVKIHQIRARKLDKDNLYGSVKPILDGMKGWLIHDDSTIYIDLTVTQETGKPVRTLIEVN